MNNSYIQVPTGYPGMQSNVHYVQDSVSNHPSVKDEKKLRVKQELNDLLEEHELGYLKGPFDEYGIETLNDLSLLGQDENVMSSFLSFIQLQLAKQNAQQLQASGLSNSRMINSGCDNIETQSTPTLILTPMQLRRLVDATKDHQEQQSARLPNSFLCPISQEIMKDPVLVIESKQVYERKFIEEWFKDHSTDPLTNCALKSKELIPVLAFQQAIDEWKEMNNYTG
jgi:hypothetical protein